jgi:hypothetical protein
MSCYYCSNKKVPTRCTPVTIDELVLGDNLGNALVDDNETALLIGLTRSGSGVEFEYNRQETT